METRTLKFYGLSYSAPLLLSFLNSRAFLNPGATG